MTRAELMGLLLAFIARLITGAQGHWKGCPPKAEQRIYFANHQSHADMVLIWAALPEELRSITRPIAAKDYWTNGCAIETSVHFLYPNVRDDLPGTAGTSGAAKPSTQSDSGGGLGQIGRAACRERV